MTTSNWRAALLAATIMTGFGAGQAGAQTADADPVAATPEEAAAQLEFLKAQVEALQAQLDAVKKTAGIITPSWKGTPEFSSGDTGYKFKLTGELQFDAGYVGNPRDKIGTQNLGFNARSRRLLVGATGTLPGDFSYTFQFNLAQTTVDYEDMIFEWAPHKTPLTFTVGYFYPFSSLENMTSNRFLSFGERAQFNDALSNGRRLGIAATYVNKAQDFRIQLGAFNQGLASANDYKNTGYQFSARTVYSPQFAGGQAHLGASLQYRRFQVDARGFNYRARPFTQTTDSRFIATGNIAAKGDKIAGIEALFIAGPLHFQGEGQYVWVDGYRPGDTVEPGQALLGTLTAKDLRYPTGFAEVGYWLTGETRGYKNGKVDRTKILHPVSEGGVGGVQLVGRVDYLDLTDRVLVATTSSGGALNVLNGGKQIGYQAGLNYWPIDYVRLTADYTRAEVTGGPFAAAADPTSTRPAYDRKYGTDVFMLRAQIDF